MPRRCRVSSLTFADLCQEALAVEEVLVVCGLGAAANLRQQRMAARNGASSEMEWAGRAELTGEPQAGPAPGIESYSCHKVRWEELWRGVRSPTGKNGWQVSDLVM